MSKCAHACEEKWNADYEAVKFQFKVTHLFPDHCPKEKRFFLIYPQALESPFIFQCLFIIVDTANM